MSGVETTWSDGCRSAALEHVSSERNRIGFPRRSGLLEEARIYLALTGICGDKVPEMANLGLADPVDAAEPLLDFVRVPRQVGVDHQVATLKFHAFTRDIIRDPYQYFPILHKAFDALASLLPRDASMDDFDCI